MTVSRLTLALAAVLAGLAAPAGAAERLALLGFQLLNTTLEPTQPAETARIAMIGQVAADELARRGFELVDTAPVDRQVANIASLHDCNGCELDLARELGADLAAVGWVQKVSNLILNLNLQIREVATGRLVHAGSVDIRGNTDESWRRGVTYLINRRIFRDDAASGAGRG